MARVRIVSLLIAAMFLALFLGVFNLTGLSGKKLRELSNKNCIRLLRQPGARGKIFDRKGEVIIDNKLSFDLAILPLQAAHPPIPYGGVLPQEAKYLDRIFSSASNILERPSGVLSRAYKRNYTASSIPVVIAKNIDSKNAIRLEELKFDFPGVLIQQKPLRNYPYERLACHVAGYINEIDRWRLTKLADYGYKTRDLVGFGGVEEKYDYYLRQEEGGLSVEVDHRARFMRVLGFAPPHNGKDIQLTIDLKIQKIAQQALADKKGCVVIMEPDTGAIIAMASFPNFNPAVFVDGPASSLSELFASSGAPMINRAISASYPAGSVFKVVVATAALETKKINSRTAFVCQGSTMVGRKEFSCWSKHGVQNLVQAIAHSCNVFFYKTGLLASAQAIHDYALKFGFSRPTNFQLPYEAGGFVPSPLWRKIQKFKNWYDGDTANLAIGQGDVLVTPLQVTRMMAVFANKGNLVAPYIVQAIDGKDIAVTQRRISPLGLKEGTLSHIRQGLRGAVTSEGGTAHVLANLPVAVACKTGTAQAPPALAHAWFVGFFPYEEPKFVACVLLEHGGPGYYACLVAKQIIEEMAKENLI